MGKSSRKKRYRTVQLSPEANEAMNAQLLAFRQKFGRDPSPEDPVFFDETKDTPQPISEEVIRAEIMAAMSKAKIPADKVYATAKTGLFPTEGNLHLLSQEDVDDWNAAIEEYNTLLRAGLIQ